MNKILVEVSAGELLDKISSWLKSNGKLFIHIFTHKTLVYPFTEDGEGDWMGRNFFSGGICHRINYFCIFKKD